LLQIVSNFVQLVSKTSLTV